MRPFTLEALKEKPLAVQSVEAFDSLCYIAELSADEQDRRMFAAWKLRKERLGQADDDNAGFRGFIVAACMCDADRKFLATDAADIDKAADSFNAANAKELTKLAEAASFVNGIGAVAVEALEKN